MTVRLAAGAVANLCEDKENHQRMVRQRGLRFVEEVLRATDAVTLREAGRIAANLRCVLPKHRSTEYMYSNMCVCACLCVLSRRQWWWQW